MTTRPILARLETLEATLLDNHTPQTDADIEEDVRAMMEHWEATVPDLNPDLARAWWEDPEAPEFPLAMAESMEAPRRYDYLLRECVQWCYLWHGRWDIGADTPLARNIRGHLDGWLSPRTEARQAWVNAGDGTPPPWARAEWEKLRGHFTPAVGPRAGQVPDWAYFHMESW